MVREGAVTVAAPSIPFDPERFCWAGVEERAYKPAVGGERGMDWRGVKRMRLASARDVSAAFELRYFELEPGGYSSLEKHRHVHVGVVLRGRGLALIGGELFDVEPFDA